jgi:hypothetical protein
MHIRAVEPMNEFPDFEIQGKRGFYRPSGKVSFEQATELVAQAIRHARSLGLASLLVNTQGFTGIAVPSIFARHQLALKFAESAGSKLHVAMVARTELIDPQKIGVIMGQNRGLSNDVFTSESEAILWLDSRHDNQA